MTQQSGRYGNKAENGIHERGMADAIGEGTKAAAEKAREIGTEALDRADEYLKPVGLSIKEKPMTVLAVIGGAAFAVGAIWMMRSSRRQSRLDQALGQLSDISRRSWW